MTGDIRWQWCHLQELAPRQTYALLAAREAVFVVEQRCVYQELDGLDLDAMHLVGWQEEDVAACLRLLAPGVRYADAALGRIMTAQPFRGRGLGRELMRRGLAYADERYPFVTISAQTHLENFYRSFGFVTVAEPYLEDGIPHMQMRRIR